MRILILIAIGLLLYLVFSNMLRRNTAQKDQHKGITENMVKCEHCGLHILEDEAVHADEHFFCSSEHRDAHRR